MRCWLLLALVLAIVGLTGSPLRAAEKEGEESEVVPVDLKKLPPELRETVRKAEHKEDTKIDIFVGALDLAIWTIVVFLVLLYVLSKYAWGPILKGMETRERNIQHAMLDAQAARDEAAAGRQQLQAQIAKANDEARQIRDQARQAAEKAAADEIARSKAELNAEKNRLVRDVETDKDQALQGVMQQAASLATLLSTKVLGREVSEEDHRRLMAEALSEFRQAAQERTRNIYNVRS